MTTSRLSCVLSGSFRRDRDGLAATFAALQERFEVLSPASIDWVDPTAEFVRAPADGDRPSRDVEDAHLRAISAADFVWLHAPGGYLGVTAAAEVGWARASGVPVYTDTAVADVTLCEFVTVAADVDAAAERVLRRVDVNPGAGVGALQAYYRRIAARRGWDDETPSEIIGLLTEELGELARAVRHHSGVARHGRESECSAADELADMHLVLVHLASSLGVDAAAAISDKEAVNDLRWRAENTSPADALGPIPDVVPSS